MTKTLLRFTVLALSLFLIASCTPSGDSGSEETADSTATENTDEAEAEAEAPPKSPRKQAAGSVDSVSVTIDYGSPSVRGRVIFGELEKYGKVWRAGANETTNIEFDSDLSMGGETIAAGKYGLFIIPNEEGDWVVIINSMWSREDHGIWGAMGYKEDKDIARITVTPEWSEDVQEELTYSVEDGSITFSWEKVKLSVPVAAAE